MTLVKKNYRLNLCNNRKEKLKGKIQKHHPLKIDKCSSNTHTHKQTRNCNHKSFSQYPFIHALRYLLVAPYEIPLIYGLLKLYAYHTFWFFVCSTIIYKVFCFEQNNRPLTMLLPLTCISLNISM